MSRRRGLVPVALAGAIILSAALSACTGTATPEPPSPTPTATAQTADQVAKTINGAPFPTASIAQATGRIEVSGGDELPVTIDVVALQALPDSTLLEVRLASASGDVADLGSFQFAVAPFLDTRNVALVDTATEKRYLPYTYANARDTGGQTTGCLCDDVAGGTDGTGILISMMMPPLPADLATADVVFPGLPKMTAVPIDRG